jgi:hypothetical protein
MAGAAEVVDFGSTEASPASLGVAVSDGSAMPGASCAWVASSVALAAAFSTAALASPASAAPSIADMVAAASGTEAGPSSARASAGRVAAAAPTRAAATTHVATRTLEIGVMHSHLCNVAALFIHDF